MFFLVHVQFEIVVLSSLVGSIGIIDPTNALKRYPWHLVRHREQKPRLRVVHLYLDMFQKLFSEDHRLGYEYDSDDTISIWETWKDQWDVRVDGWGKLEVRGIEIFRYEEGTGWPEV